MCIDINKFINAGYSFEYIVEYLETNKSKYKTYFIVNDLTFLIEGGRVNPTIGNFGKMLNIKPILSIEDGAIKMIAKPRGMKQVYEFFKKLFDDNYFEHVGFINIKDTDFALEFKKEIEKMYSGRFDNIDLNLVTASHLGPDAIAIAVKESLY